MGPNQWDLKLYGYKWNTMCEMEEIINELNVTIHTTVK